MTSFATDIAPMFAPFRCPMTWRFDLGSYEDVKFHYDAILGQIETQQMPPQPFLPLSNEQVATFKRWKSESYPP